MRIMLWRKDKNETKGSILILAKTNVDFNSHSSLSATYVAPHPEAWRPSSSYDEAAEKLASCLSVWSDCDVTSSCHMVSTSRFFFHSPF